MASQNPTDINEAIFSNVGTNFILRIKFERFMNYIQGSLNFSDFIRDEISKFGVGQAAVEMAFQTSLRFPETFILERIHGEEPLYVYTIDMSDILVQSEIAANVLTREYQFEKEELKNKLIEYNVSSEAIDGLFTSMDGHQRSMKILDLVRNLNSMNVSISNVVSFLKSMSIEDTLITRIISSSGVEHG